MANSDDVTSSREILKIGDIAYKRANSEAIMSRFAATNNFISKLQTDIKEFKMNGSYSVATGITALYVPSGSSKDDAQARKDVFMERFTPHMAELLKEQREVIICADWNICHREIDLKNWRGNQKNSGFLPHERAWLDRVFEELGWVDVFRQVTPGPDQYTWWSNRGQAWAKNVGWRLDYMLTTPRLSGSALSSDIYREERFSDHAPLTIDFKI